MSGAFAEWRVRREKKAEADRARRRKAAKLRAKAPKPLPPEPETFERVCRTHCQLWRSCDGEAESDLIADLQIGARVRVLDRRALLADNLQRVRVSVAEQAGVSGWVACRDQRSSPVLLEVTRTHALNPQAASWLSSLEPEQRAIEEVWSLHLSAAAFRVCRMKGTDDAHHGEYIEHFAPGAYACAACGQSLYLSTHKFASACGWP